MADYFQGAEILTDIVAGAAFAAVEAYVSSQYIDLANNYYDLYQEQRNFYYNNFQQNGEAPLVTELSAIPFYVPDYSGVSGASSIYYFAPELAFQLGNFTPTFTNHLRMFNSADLSPVVPSAVALAEIADDWDSYYFRLEEHKRDVYNARRWEQEMDALAYGVKTAANVERGLATSFMYFDEANGQLNSSINSIGNGFFAYQGYRKEVKELLQTPSAQRSNFSSNFDVTQMSNG